MNSASPSSGDSDSRVSQTPTSFCATSSRHRTSVRPSGICGGRPAAAPASLVVVASASSGGCFVDGFVPFPCCCFFFFPFCPAAGGFAAAPGVVAFAFALDPPPAEAAATPPPTRSRSVFFYAGGPLELGTAHTHTTLGGRETGRMRGRQKRGNQVREHAPPATSQTVTLERASNLRTASSPLVAGVFLTLPRRACGFPVRVRPWQ